MRLYCVVLIVMLICVHRSTSREVTHEDIRDAMLSLVHIIRSTDDKLERHEFREKALGEHIKKALANLDKRRTLDPLKGAISRLDERLSSVETILMEKEEREKQQMKKNDEMIETFKNTLNTWSESITNMVRTEIKNIPKPVFDNSGTEQKIVKLEESLTKKIDAITSNVNSIKEATNVLKENQSKIQAECKKSGLDEKALGKHMNDTEKLLSKYENKLSEYKLNITNLEKEILPLGEITLADEAWHSKMTEVLDKQHQTMQGIQKSLTNTEEAIKLLPTSNDMQNSNNKTLKTIREIQYDITSNAEKGLSKITTDLSEIKKQNEMLLEELGKNITECNELTGKMYTDVMKGYETLPAQIQSLTKLERVMIQTADNVLDTKRIEYGVQQILSEISDTIKSHNKDLNSTIHHRFDEIELSIVENQMAALQNISTKIEQEMSQVWRQIGIMYKQLTDSNSALDKLQAQTDQYVNGTITTMDSMEGKVGKITKRMMDVDENLNFLLGRLSLVTQEFNQIKTGLGSALDDIKNSFLLVQSKIKDASPGPHYITSAEEH